MLTIHVKTRKGNKTNQEKDTLLPGDMFAALVFFRNEEENLKVRRQSGANLCVGRLELEKTETVLLYSSQKSHQPLSWMLKAVPWSCVQRL